MASVYLARHRVHGGFCAVKVLADHLAKQPPLVKSFLTEARASASLDEHPNIVNIVDIDQQEGLYFMIMKYVEGEDLSTYLHRKQKLPWRQAAYIAAETAEALDYSHERGVIHRDLKPSNIRLNRRGGVTVMDFGIAKVGQTPSSFTEMGTRVGTPHYMSPEQIKGERVDHRSDLYGLGVILYQMATGVRPFDGANATEIWQAHLGPPPPPAQELEPSIPDPLNHIISTMLARDLDKRYDAAERIVRHLRTLGLDDVAATLEPVDQLDLDELRTRTLSGSTAAEAFDAQAPITETAQTSGPPPMPAEAEPEAEAEATVEEAPPPAERTLPAEPAASEPATEQAVDPPPPAPEEPTVAEPEPQSESEAPPPTLPPPAPREPSTITEPFSSPGRSPIYTPLKVVLIAALATVVAIGAYFLMRQPDLPVRPAAEQEVEPAETEEAAAADGNEGEESEAVEQAAAPAPRKAPAKSAPRKTSTAKAPPKAPSKPAGPRTGAIYFRSEPSGATVQVGARPDWNCETPCWLESLTAGEHTVTARLDGYRVAIQKIKVERGAREPLQLTLEPDVIGAMIASEPQGAEIYIDGVKRPEKTNARIPLRAGSYQVRVVLPGVAEGEQVLVVDQSQMPYANFVLQAQ